MVAPAVKLGQGTTARDVQAGQLIYLADKTSHIASDYNRLARKTVELCTIIILLTSLLSPLNGDVAISFNGQFDSLSDPLRGGHGDDALGEERAGREKRAEEGEEPDA